ncbi:MAG: T9SS type A sorting domain-containing protein, partial [Ignavibacteriota bacterium]
GTGNSKLLKSTDDGINWTQINSSFTSINDLDVNGIVLYINHTTPYFSTDLGETWTQINLAGGPNSFQKIKVANGYFYGAGGGSVGKSIYRKNLSSIVNIEVQEYLLPVAYDLLQNYPNPFNPSTKISWQSPVGSHQTLKIYDVLGNEVATLLDEYTEAGRYEITFDASRLASGIYFYRLQAGQFIETRKMILLK